MVIPTNITNLIFDYDGVLGDSTSFNKYACQKSAQLLGVELTDEVFAHCTPGGATIKDIAHCIMSHHGMPEKSNEFIAHKKSFDREYAEKVKLYPGVPTVITRLNRDYKLAVNTGTRHVLVDSVLKKSGIYNFFDVVVAAEDISKGKPDPESYQLSCQKLQANPKNCLVIEDGSSGITSALKAGCVVAGLTTNHRSEMLLALGCHYVIDDLDELMVPTAT